MAEADKAARWSGLTHPDILPRLLIVLLGVWINAADNLVTTTIMPSVAADIGGHYAFSWAVAGFLVGAVVAAASSGRLAELFGLGQASGLAGLLFALGCLASAMAPGMEIFLAGRLIQGLGSGWFSGFAMVAIAQIFPRPQIARIFALVSGVWGVATLLGPLLGGLLAETGNWRVVFWAFAGQALVFAALAPRYFRIAQAPSARQAIPVLQLLLIALAIGAVGLANSAGKGAGSAAMIAAGIALLALALAIDRKARAHLLPRDAANPYTVIGAGYLAVLALTACSMPFGIFAPPILQQLLGLTPVEAGYAVGGSAITWTLATFAVSSIEDGRDGWAILLGAALIPAGVVLQALALPSQSLAFVIVAGMITGIGFGMCSPLINRRAINHLSPEEEAIGSAALMTTRQIGGAIGAALAGTVANLAGFGAGLTDASAMATADTVYWAMLPLGLLGLAGAVAMVRRRPA